MVIAAGQKLRTVDLSQLSQPYLVLTGTGGSVANNADVALSYGAVTENNTGLTWWASGSNIVVPAGLGGLYHLDARVYWAASASGNQRLIHWQHGSGAANTALWTTSDGIVPSASVPDANLCKISDTVRLVAGDTYQLFCFQNSSGALSISSSWTLVPPIKVSLTWCGV